MERPFLSVTSITIGTDRPHDLAAFYVGLLGWRITGDEPPVPGDPDAGGWAQVSPPDGEPGPTLNFEYERTFVAPVWPAEPGRQFASQHLDISVHDLDAAEAWARACGARSAPVQPQADVRVMLDPSGHPFCLFT